MGDLIKEAITSHEKRTDRDIMERYSNQLVSRFPMTVELESLSAIMTKRKIEFKGLQTIATFHVDGKEMHKVVMEGSL